MATWRRPAAPPPLPYTRFDAQPAGADLESHKTAAPARGASDGAMRALLQAIASLGRSLGCGRRGQMHPITLQFEQDLEDK